MNVRRWLVAGLAVALVPSAVSATGVSAAPKAIPLPAIGNVSVARLTIVAQRGQAAPLPKLGVTSSGRLPATVLVIGGVARDSVKPGRFVGTIGIFNRPLPPGKPGQPNTVTPPSSPGSISVRLPSGYALVGQQAAANVLYQNARPRFSLDLPGSVSLLSGSPLEIAPLRLLADARKLALDQVAPVADMKPLGLQYITAQLSHVGGRATSFAVTIAIANLSQVNAIQLTFPAGLTVVSAAGPPLTGVAPQGQTLQLLASQGFFAEVTAYPFTFVLDQALLPSSFFTLQASTHYFENVLPFTERFYVHV